MYPGYHYQNDRHALLSLARPIYRPEQQLAVETGEQLIPLGMKVLYNTRSGRDYVVVPDLNSTAYEQASIDGQRVLVSEDDFPKENYFGDVLDDVGVISNGGV